MRVVHAQESDRFSAFNVVNYFPVKQRSRNLGWLGFDLQVNLGGVFAVVEVLQDVRSPRVNVQKTRFSEQRKKVEKKKVFLGKLSRLT